MKKYFIGAFIVIVLIVTAIVGINRYASAATPSGQSEVTSAQNSAQCLDVTLGQFNGGVIQVWTCGAANGRDQDIKFFSGKMGNPEGVLEVFDPSSSTPSVPVGCVQSDPNKKDPFRVQACDNEADQIVLSFAKFLEFPGTGFVMDGAGRSVVNGTVIQNWPVNGGLNQQWNLTAAP